MLVVFSTYSLSETSFVDHCFCAISYMRTYETYFKYVLDYTQRREYNGPRLIADASRVRTKYKVKEVHNETEDHIDRGVKCGLCNGTEHNRRVHNTKVINSKCNNLFNVLMCIF